MEDQEINMMRPEGFEPNFTENNNKRPPKKFIIIAIIAILIGGFFVLRYYGNKQSQHPVSYDPVTLKPKKTGFLESVKNAFFGSDNVVKGQQDDRINILLLGIGGSGHDGPYLSDTNIIVSIKPSTKQVAMISIPRDLGVKIGSYGIRKINNADAFGESAQPGNGGEYARKIFEETFGLNIPYYIRVDFTAFKELIDAVDGVNINVERSFTDYSYPGPNFSYQTVSFKAGQQTMTGEQALIFARSRHGTNGEGSDFARAKRQQLVLSNLKQKLLSPGIYLNPVRIQKILSSLSSNITTNLDFGEIMYLAGMAKEVDGNITNLVLDDGPNGFLKSLITEDGAYMLAPKAGDFVSINEAIKNVFETSSSTTKIAEVVTTTTKISSPNIEVQNGTWRLGLASKTKLMLEQKGYRVQTIGNTVKKPVAETTLYVFNTNIDKTTIENLQSLLHAKTSYTLPEWLSETYDDPNTSANEFGPKFNLESDILVILGDNFES